jgi:hypothetical protein
VTDWVPYNEHDELVRAMAEIERLEGALRNIRDHALGNGEDCAYLDAKAALEDGDE